ncbi:MAG: protein kinase [bacterium]|nr:protein kinase [bacterium]
MLSPEQVQRVKELFHRAADLPSAERVSFVEHHCAGEEALRDTLCSLLQELDEDATFLETWPSLEGEGDERATPGVPERIGRYRILEKIGEGGMGAVYLAEQEEPVHRKVALKILRMGMNSAQLVARFESERQALALMDHPSVAHWFDAGATDTGRPYLVMEYVPGEPITRYCDERRLRLEERLELFTVVCEALDHAHRKGIIHRDVKPSNVLVMEADGRPVPKVIDFGIARLTDEDSVARMTLTRTGQVVGTLEYMSPEQAQPQGHTIDSRTDVYSLGGLLYELLTGSLPFDWEALRHEPFWEQQRTLCDEKPERPSTRLARAGEDLDVSAHKRHTNANTLVRQVRGDLDWIVLKALETEPARRYSSAAELALDVRCFLDDKPVFARKPSRVYHLRKLVRRNRAVVAAACVAMLALIGGLVVTTIGLLREQRARVDLESQAYFKDIAAAGAAIEVHDVAEARRRLEAIPRRFRPYWEWRYLAGEVDHSERTLRAHRDATVVAWHPNGAVIASASDRIQLWDPETYQPRGTLDTEIDNSGWSLNGVWKQDLIVRLQFSRDGTRLASVRESISVAQLPVAIVEVWDWAGGDRVSGPHVFPAAKASWSTRLGPDLLRVAYQDYDLDIAVQEIGSGEPTFTFSRHERKDGMDTYASLAWGPDGERIASVFNGTLRIWEAHGGEQTIDQIDVPAVRLGASYVAFSPGGDIVAASDTSGDVQLWNANDGEWLSSLVGHENVVNWIAFSPLDAEGGVHIATASHDRTVRIWDGADRRPGAAPLATLHGHESGTSCVAFSPNGHRVVSAALQTGSALKVWDVGLAQSQRIGEGLTGATRIGPDGETFLSNGWPPFPTPENVYPDRYPRLVHADQPSDSRYLDPGLDRTQMFKIAMSADAALLATGNPDGDLAFWDGRSGEQIGEVIETGPFRQAMAFDPRGARLAAGTGEGQVELWSTSEHKLEKDLGSLPREVSAMAYSREGALLAAGDWWGNVAIWSTDDWTQKSLLIDNSKILRLAFRPGGRVLAVAVQRIRRDGSAAVRERAIDLVRIDVETGTEIGPRTRIGATHETHWAVVSLSFTDDGSRLLCAGSSDALIHLIDPDTGDKILALNGPHLYRVSGARFLQQHNDQLVSVDVFGNVTRWYPGRGDRFAHGLDVTEPARALVDELLEEHGDLEIVTRRLREHPDCKDPILLDAALRYAYAPAMANTSLDHRIRELRERMASGYPSAQQLGITAWEIVGKPGRKGEWYDSAVEMAREATRLNPEAHVHLSTLGVALYRAGQFEEALEFLQRADKGNQREGQLYHRALDLAFIALCRHAQGDTDEARRVLAEVKALCADEKNAEALGFLREATDKIVGESSVSHR